jgi:hypothetical protein
VQRDPLDTADVSSVTEIRRPFRDPLMCKK